MEQFKNTYELEKFLDDSDIFLYQKILELIVRDQENINPDLLDKLGELHINIRNTVHRKKQHELFNENHHRRLMKECVSTLSQLISHLTKEHNTQK